MDSKPRTIPGLSKRSISRDGTESEENTVPFEDYQRNIMATIQDTEDEPGTHRSMPNIGETEDLRASQIAKPGGFRRTFLHQQRIPENEILDEEDSILIANKSCADSQFQNDTKQLVENISDSYAALLDFYCTLDNNYSDSLAGIFDDRTTAELTKRQERLKGRGVSTCKTVVNILKSFIGCGIMYLPQAYHNGGYIAAPMLVVLSACFSTMGMLKLADCHQKVPSTYAGIGRAAFGRVGYVTVSIMLALSQFSFGIVSVVFAVNIVSSLIKTSLKPRELELILNACFLLVLIPLSFIRRISNMKYVNISAICCIAAGLIYVMTYAGIQLQDRGTIADKVEAVNKHNILSFLGTSVYIFEGIGVAIPIKETMAKPQNFNLILCIMIIGTALILTGFPVLCYLAWGPAIHEIALNQPDSPSWLSSTFKCLYVIQALLGYPLLMYPTFTIIENNISKIKKMPSSPLRTGLKNLLRVGITCLVVICSFIASSDAEMFISLVGAVCAVPVAFIFPAVFHMKLVGGSIITDAILLAMGVAMVPLCTYISIKNWGSHSLAHGSEPVIFAQ